MMNDNAHCINIGIEEVERKLNERQRKRHGFLSPNQVFSKSTGLDARMFV